MARATCAVFKTGLIVIKAAYICQFQMKPGDEVRILLCNIRVKFHPKICAHC